MNRTALVMLVGTAFTLAATNGTISNSTSSLATSTSAALGSIILQGLGSSDTVSSTTVSSTLTVPATFTSVASFAGNLTTSATSTTGTNGDICQAAQLSWSSALSQVVSIVYNTTSYVYALTNTTYTGNITYGTADVYTTQDGVPRAHGTLTPTSVTQFVTSIVNLTTSYDTITSTPFSAFSAFTSTNASPNCTISASQCERMWESYFASLGLPTTNLSYAVEPAITPMPSNRPRCSFAPYTADCEEATPACYVSGRSVDLFYWPEPTSAPNATAALASNATMPVTTVYGNVTFTSPSVYLSLDYLHAISTQFADICTAHTPLGATAPAEGVAGIAITNVGPTLTNVLVSLDPTSLSSIVRDLGPNVNTASVVSVIAHGGADYEKWMPLISDNPYYTHGDSYQSYIVKPVELHNIALPSPEAYYLNPNVAPGCNNYGPHPECSTIFNEGYKPQLMVPDQVRALASEWATCLIPLEGVYDPPKALQPENAPNGPSTHNTVPATTTPTPQQPATSPAATALPQSDPTTAQPTGGNAKPTQENSPSPAQSSPEQSHPQATNDPTDATSPATSNGGSGGSTPQAQPSSGGNGGSVPSPSDGTTDASSEERSSTDPAGVIASIVGGGTIQVQATGANSADPANDPATSSDPAGVIASIVGGGTAQASAPANVDPASAANDPTSVADPTTRATQASVEQTGAADPDTSAGSGSPGSQPIVATSPASQVAGGGDSPSQSGAILSIGSSTLKAVQTVLTGSNGKGTTAAVIDGTTLTQGGSAQTINGQTVSLESSGIVVNGEQTQAITALPSSSGANAAAVLTFGSSTVNVQQTIMTGSDGRATTEAIIGGNTLTPGGSATVNGHTVVLGSSGVVVDGTVTHALTAASTIGALLTLGSSTVIAQQTVVTGSNGQITTEAVIDGATIVSGSSAVIDGHAVTLGSNGVVADGTQTAAFSAVTSDAGWGLVAFTEHGQIFTATLVAGKTGLYIVDGTTISAGGAAVTLPGDVTVTARSSALVVDGSSTVRITSASASSPDLTAAATSPGSTAVSAASRRLHPFGSVTLSAAAALLMLVYYI